VSAAAIAVLSGGPILEKAHAAVVHYSGVPSVASGKY